MPLDSLDVLDRDGLSPDDVALIGYHTPIGLILARARYLIATKGWSRCSMARGRLWPVIDPLSQHARKFCAIGAIHRAAYDLGYHYKNGCRVNYVGEARTRLERQILGGESVIDWNDNRVRDGKEVLATFDRALKEFA